ncbi:hypothetical protein DPMN_064057 [Dreissena polymorpha]|uniref:Uncharacterized protein n=1 Tax=Dreissena polymorpha TaxID=45954 RepID=A0A9D4CCN2_DREPO|nr:hypothetical protein DPMN_064057 [Dreissena polymorpha]
MGWTNLHRHSVVYLCLCAPPSLRHLNISGCRENITDEGRQGTQCRHWTLDSTAYCLAQQNLFINLNKSFALVV